MISTKLRDTVKLIQLRKVSMAKRIGVVEPDSARLHRGLHMDFSGRKSSGAPKRCARLTATLPSAQAEKRALSPITAAAMFWRALAPRFGKIHGLAATKAWRSHVSALAVDAG